MELRNQEITPEVNINEEAEQNSAFSAPEEEKSKRFGFFKSALFTKPFWVLIGIFVFSLIVYIISRFSTVFAEFWTRYPAQAIRFILAKATDLIPFSLAEGLLLLLPFLALFYIIGSIVATKRDESDETFYKWLRPVVSIILVIGMIFFLGFGPAYGRSKLSDNLGITQAPVSSDELFETGIILAKLVSHEIENVSFDLSGSSVMPYSYKELQSKVNQAYEKFDESNEFITHFSSKPKAIALSEPMTYTHISGVYTFMTGEANINTNYPNFLVPFTMAHEMAHQRGIAREDEANFVAFLVCIGSDDSYLRYCGYSNMLNYINSALVQADKEKYIEFYYGYTPIEVRREFYDYALFFDKYRESVASDISGAVNDTFLQSQGQKEGTRSYGLVVDLAVAYYKQ